ncbi:MAG: YggS family pyridoxal phosphate-dependent enzyme [Rhodoferax sp.]|nr:YggS family pyridoxal phosphate-dependent enzyme [Rhodoferax sp.]
MTTIEHNLQAVRARIEAACRACGRDPQSVTLLAVSKTFGLDAIAAARIAGQQAFGENYIQEAVGKITVLQQSLPDGLPAPVWHCIGPVQSNKTRLVAEHFDWVHTVDRLKTAQRLNEQRPQGLAPLQVCIQVNVDGGANKSGVAPQELAELAQHLTELPRLRLRGLMSLPEPAPDFEASKAVFMRVRALFDALNSQGYGLDVLSLGMSADLEAAIHAGSTLVRVGSAIFGARSRAA